MPYTIFAIAGNNGVISHEGLVTWDPEFQPTYTVTPDAGYELADLRINNKSVVVANNSYTFPPLTANATIRAIFQPKVGHSLWGMGSNEQGQLCTDDNDQQNYPYRMVDQSVTAVAMGMEHCLWLRSDGILWGAGSNGHGQLGFDRGHAIFFITTPTQLRASDVVAIAAGSYHSLLLQTDGQLWAMGQNDHGQLGIGNTVDQYAPVQVPTTAPVVAISAGDAHSMFLLDDGTLWTMGANKMGQLGVGDTVDRTSPCQVPVPDNKPVGLIAAGFDHSIFSVMHGDTYAMGFNTFGQLANGDADSLPHPDPLPVITEVGKVIKVHGATGGYSSAFYYVGFRGGNIRTAGNNSHGQLAVSPFTDQGVHVPTAVTWLAQDLVSLAIGHAECLGIGPDGSLWGIGQNTWGLLGIGSQENLPDPVKVCESVFKVVISARNSGLLGTEIPSSTCVITARAGAHGSVSPAGSSGRSIYNFGDRVTYTFTPDAGYHVANVWVDGKSSGAPPSIEFPPLAANHQIVVEFAQTIYTITVVQPQNGTIDPAAPPAYAPDATPTFAISPNPGYKISDVSVNGISVDAVDTYKFPKLQANQTITATMDVLPTYTISPSAGPHGSISPNTPQVVNQGATPSFTLLPADNYRLITLSISGALVNFEVSPTGGCVYSFPAVSANQTIAGTFSLFALQLNGSNQYLKGAALVNVLRPYTISGWFEGTGGLYTQGDGSEGYRGAVARVWTSNGQLYFANEDASGSEWYFTMSAPCGAGSHHFAGTFDGTTAQLYLDGTLVATAKVKGIVHLGSAAGAIGRTYTDADYFKGGLGKFGFATSALTADVITALYHEGLPRAWKDMNSTQQGLFAHFYNLDESVDSVYPDQVGGDSLTLRTQA